MQSPKSLTYGLATLRLVGLQLSNLLAWYPQLEVLRLANCCLTIRNLLTGNWQLVGSFCSKNQLYFIIRSHTSRPYLEVNEGLAQFNLIRDVSMSTDGRRTKVALSQEKLWILKFQTASWSSNQQDKQLTTSGTSKDIN